MDRQTVVVHELDVLAQLDELCICEAYEIRGERTTDFPSHVEDLEVAKPVFRKIPGWKQDITRARKLSDEEIDEILSLQGTGGPLNAFGVDAFVQRIERRRKLIEQVHVIAGTEYLDLLEQFVGLLFEKVQPPPERR